MPLHAIEGVAPTSPIALLCQPVVAQHALLPPLVAGVPALQQFAQKRAVTAITLQGPSAVGQQFMQTALQAGWGHHSRGIDPHPALALQPDLGPGMRIGLPQHHIAADGIPFPALITGDHACRQTCSTHQQCVGRGKVAAKAQSCVEQQIIDRVEVQQRRCQAVFEAAVVQIVEYPLHIIGLAVAGRAQLSGQSQGARVALRRQLQIKLACGVGERRFVAGLQIRDDVIGLRLGDRLRGQQLPVKTQPYAG